MRAIRRMATSGCCEDPAVGFPSDHHVVRSASRPEEGQASAPESTMSGDGCRRRTRRRDHLPPNAKRLAGRIRQTRSCSYGDSTSAGATFGDSKSSQRRRVDSARVLAVQRLSSWRSLGNGWTVRSFDNDPRVGGSCRDGTRAVIQSTRRRLTSSHRADIQGASVATRRSPLDP